MSSQLINKEAATRLANDFLVVQPKPKDFGFVVLDEYTIERERCYVFFYESSRFIETGRFEDRLVGNGPILVDRETSAVSQLGTALPVENYIKDYEARFTPS
jgi:hypothetical protein